MDSIISADIPVTYQEYANPWFKRQEKEHQSHPYHAIKQGKIYDLNLIFYNLLEFSALSLDELQALTRDKYTIVYWLWEQAIVPESLREAFYYVDEIWTASHYCQQAFSAVRPIPVHVIPHPIQIVDADGLTKAELGLAEGRPSFLFSFAAISSDIRKNPLAVIEAFRRAFPQDSPQSPILIIKAHHLDMFPDYASFLREQVASVKGILIEESLSRQAMNQLLASVDCYISLHRAEGFGIGMAEAMALGKPVIATNYSGNLDFMTDENSFLVRHRLGKITADDFKHQSEYTEVYEIGQTWAEPDLDHAAELMQFVVANPELARARGQVAKASIEQNFSSEAVASKIQARLAEIDPTIRHSVWQYMPTRTEQDKHDELLALLKRGEENFREWEYRRIPETRQAIYQIPLIGYFLRILERVKNLGKMWANLKFVIESSQQFDRKMLKELESLHDHQPAIHKLRADIRLHHQRQAQDAQEIEQLKSEIAELKRQIEALQNAPHVTKNS